VGERPGAPAEDPIDAPDRLADATGPRMVGHRDCGAGRWSAGGSGSLTVGVPWKPTVKLSVTGRHGGVRRFPGRCPGGEVRGRPPASPTGGCRRRSLRADERELLGPTARSDPRGEATDLLVLLVEGMFGTAVIRTPPMSKPPSDQHGCSTALVSVSSTLTASSPVTTAPPVDHEGVTGGISIRMRNGSPTDSSYSSHPRTSAPSTPDRIATVAGESPTASRSISGRCVGTSQVSRSVSKPPQIRRAGDLLAAILYCTAARTPAARVLRIE